MILNNLVKVNEVNSNSNTSIYAPHLLLCLIFVIIFLNWYRESNLGGTLLDRYPILNLFLIIDKIGILIRS
jgi:hypothetical protein